MLAPSYYIHIIVQVWINPLSLIQDIHVQTLHIFLLVVGLSIVYPKIVLRFCKIIYRMWKCKRQKRVKIERKWKKTMIPISIIVRNTQYTHSVGKQLQSFIALILQHTYNNNKHLSYRTLHEVSNTTIGFDRAFGFITLICAKEMKQSSMIKWLILQGMFVINKLLRYLYNPIAEWKESEGVPCFIPTHDYSMTRRNNSIIAPCLTQAKTIASVKMHI